MLLWCAHYITIPLGKIHRHVVDVLTICPYHSVNSIDTWCLVCKYDKKTRGTWYTIKRWKDTSVVPGISWSLGKRVSFYRFIVSLSFYRYHYRYTKIVSVRYFLSYRFQTIIPKRSVRYPPQTFISSVFSTPFLLFSCPFFWLSLYSFCSNHTIHIQTRVHSPMLSDVGNDTHQTTSQSGPTAVEREGHFFPRTIYS